MAVTCFVAIAAMAVTCLACHGWIGSHVLRLPWRNGSHVLCLPRLVCGSSHSVNMYHMGPAWCFALVSNVVGFMQDCALKPGACKEGHFLDVEKDRAGFYMGRHYFLAVESERAGPKKGRHYFLDVESERVGSKKGRHNHPHTVLLLYPVGASACRQDIRPSGSVGAPHMCGGTSLSLGIYFTCEGLGTFEEAWCSSLLVVMQRC
jgi:hypothetical protein